MFNILKQDLDSATNNAFMRYLVLGNKIDLRSRLGDANGVDPVRAHNYVRSLHPGRGGDDGGNDNGIPRVRSNDGELWYESSVKDNINISEPFRQLVLRTLVDFVQTESIRRQHPLVDIDLRDEVVY
jgi:hypothetical protein